LLVIGGADPFNAGLHRYEPCSGRVTVAAAGTRYSAVSAAGATVAVASAANGADTVSLVRHGALAPLDGVGTPRGLSPAVSASGSVAYVVVDPDKQRPFAVTVWSPSSRSARVVYRSGDAIGPIAWGARDVLSIARRPARPTAGEAASATVTSLAVAATPRLLWERRVPFDPRQVTWSPDGTAIAVTGTSVGVVLTGAGKDKARLPSSWFAYGWSQDSRYVLVGSGAKLAMVRPGAMAVEDPATYPLGPVYAAAWAT
jgi:hypothetical protein